MTLPAARVSDNHICPVHGGGPVAPPGCSKVLANGLAMARAKDECTCAGGIDPIVTGASTVWVGGRLAARLTDKTMHGRGIMIGLSPNVLIGGPTGGAAVGGASQGGDEACRLAAVGRASNSKRQTYGNCGIESARQILNHARSSDLTENGLADDAVAHGEADEQPVHDTHFGGTNPEDRQKLLARHGVSSSLVEQDYDALLQAVAERRGVITSHDAGTLWGDASYLGEGHAVLMTGVVFGADGEPVWVIINDTGNGGCGDLIPAERFFGSMRHRRAANVTNEPIWGT